MLTHPDSALFKKAVEGSELNSLQSKIFPRCQVRRCRSKSGHSSPFLTDIARFFFSPAAGFSIHVGDGISLPGIIPQPYDGQGKRDYDPAHRTKIPLISHMPWNIFSELTGLTLPPFSRKHLLTASVGQQQQSGATADPQILRAKSITAHSHPVPISSAADLRRPSSGSVISSSDADASSVSRLPLSGVDTHVPHLICKWKPQSICPLASGFVIGWSGVTLEMAACWRIR